jgi:hypothetical protein
MVVTLQGSSPGERGESRATDGRGQAARLRQGAVVFGGTAHGTHIYGMETFWDWLRFRNLLEAAWYSFNPAQYNTLFDSELEKVIARVRDPTHRQALERMQTFDWTGYVSSWVRHAGFRDYREVQEKTHEVVTTLLMGKLFRGFDERVSGPMDKRFKCAVGNAVRNLVAKEKTRRRYLPSVSIAQEFVPGSVTAEELPAKSARDDDDDDEKIIHDFRELVRRRLGDLAVAVLDARLDGIETKALVGNPSLGSPGKWTIKKVVVGIKALAREYALKVGDPEMLRRIEGAMRAEQETIGRRRAAMAIRQGAGA